MRERFWPVSFGRTGKKGFATKAQRTRRQNVPKGSRRVQRQRSGRESISGPAPFSTGEETIATVENAAGIILAVTENRHWIEVFFGGDLMHTRTIDLPAGKMFNIFVEDIPHKTTVYEHPRTMIFFTDPCDLRISRDGDKVMVASAGNAAPEVQAKMAPA